jgi:hypothetical protein
MLLVFRRLGRCLPACKVCAVWYRRPIGARLVVDPRKPPSPESRLPWKTIAWRNCERSLINCSGNRPRFWNHVALAQPRIRKFWNTRSGKKSSTTSAMSSPTLWRHSGRHVVLDDVWWDRTPDDGGKPFEATGLVPPILPDTERPSEDLEFDLREAGGRLERFHGCGVSLTPWGAKLWTSRR